MREREREKAHPEEDRIERTRKGGVSGRGGAWFEHASSTGRRRRDASGRGKEDASERRTHSFSDSLEISFPTYLTTKRSQESTDGGDREAGNGLQRYFVPLRELGYKARRSRDPSQTTPWGDHLEKRNWLEKIDHTRKSE